MKKPISYPELNSFRRMSYLHYFLGFLPFMLVTLGAFYNIGFLFFVLFLSIPTFLNFRYFLHIIQAVSLEMDNHAFYFTKNQLDYVIPFESVKSIKTKHLPTRKWRKIIYYITLVYEDKHQQKHTIYFLSTDQAENYTWSSFFGKVEIPYLITLKEHIYENTHHQL